MKAIILAAGYATRLYPLTLDKPKALLPIGGRTMLDHLVEGIADIGDVNDVHIVTNSRFASLFEDWASAAERENRYPGLNFSIWDDGTSSNEDRLGAIGDMQFVLDRVDMNDDVLVAASDNFFTFPLKLFAEEYRRQGRDMLLAGQIDDVETLRRFAVATVSEDGLVTSFVEKPQDPPSDIGIYAMYIYKKETIARVKEYLDGGNNPDSPGMFPEWLFRTGTQLGAYVFEGECIDIGTVESYGEVRRRFG